MCVGENAPQQWHHYPNLTVGVVEVLEDNRNDDVRNDECFLRPKGFRGFTDAHNPFRSLCPNVIIILAGKRPLGRSNGLPTNPKFCARK